MSRPQFEELDGQREDDYALIINVMTPYHSSFEMSDIPMYLAKYQSGTLNAIANELRPFSPEDTGNDFAKQRVRLVRSITGTCKERFVVTALKSMDFFCLEAACNKAGAYDGVDYEDSRTISQIMEDTFKLTSIKPVPYGDVIAVGHSYDADHHARVLKAQRVADIIKLESSVAIKMDYYLDMDLLARNVDLIEPAVGVIAAASKVVYAKSMTLPDGSGLRPLLRAKDVIAIAEVCGSDQKKQDMVLNLIRERGSFDFELLEMVANAASQPLAVGIL